MNLARKIQYNTYVYILTVMCNSMCTVYSSLVKTLLNYIFQLFETFPTTIWTGCKLLSKLVSRCRIRIILLDPDTKLSSWKPIRIQIQATVSQNFRTPVFVIIKHLPRPGAVIHTLNILLKDGDFSKIIPDLRRHPHPAYPSNV
jgi:hypothetical protein